MEISMSTSTPEMPRPDTPTCPSWCDAHHADPEVINHVRLVDAVHNRPIDGSVAVEIEQANDQNPHIVLSVFTTIKPRSISADLTLHQACHAYTALGEALRLANETVR
jgi:hypothetical protein